MYHVIHNFGLKGFVYHVIHSFTFGLKVLCIMLSILLALRFCVSCYPYFWPKGLVYHVIHNLGLKGFVYHVIHSFTFGLKVLCIMLSILLA